ncbi:MAG: transglycosylase SLT domain-containing protein [Bacteroidia bacterium]|nr:transglycosylase SLT domain-containing protein [Bacteroidia bacterium]
MKKYLIFVGVIGLLAFSPSGGKNNTTEKKNKLISEKKAEKVIPTKKSIQEISDSICFSIGVPPNLVREIGQNESGWRCIKSLSGGTDFGDLQVIEETFDYWYDRLELTGGKTRYNYLVVGIHYLKYNYDRYHSWEKARFAYARGSWRSKSTWTCLEEKFMGKINWSEYDRY